MNELYNLKAELPSGELVSLGKYKGKVILIANTASKCWLTYQYQWLEDLYKKYKDDWLVVLWFPCNQFANQEPWDDNSIKQNCLINYGVTFPVFKKIKVNWYNTHEIFDYLKNNSNSFFWKKIKWNFTKFLVSKDWKTIKRFAPIVKPEKLESQIIKFLK